MLCVSLTIAYPAAPCPAGIYCRPDTNAAVDTACAAGWYSTGMCQTCVQCPAGYECATATEDPVACLVMSGSAFVEKTLFYFSIYINTYINI